MNRINERLWVVEIALSKTSKTVRDRHVKLSLIRRSAAVGLERSQSLVTRCIPVVLLIRLELDFSTAYKNGGCGHTLGLVR